MIEGDMRAALAHAQTVLPGADSRLEAELLLIHVLDRSRAWLYAHQTDPINLEQRMAFDALLQRRRAGEPIAYLIGCREFWSLRLRVTPATLIPRAETELLVECALALIPADAAWRLADLGTGSGAIALALARERPRCRVLATDVSAAALAVALHNATALAIPNVEFSMGSWCAALGNERFALIVSNPPYIAANDAHLRQGDLRFEPASALASGADGLQAIVQIAEQSRERLLPGAWLLLEHGNAQGEAVRNVLRAAGYRSIETRQDLEQRDRVTLACWDP